MQNSSVVYGFHSAEEAIRNHPDRINHVWASTGAQTHRLQELLQEAHRRKIPVSRVEKHVLARLAGTQHHQDIVLQLSPFHYSSAEELMAGVNDRTLFCILDEIQDTTNLGTLIRTMDGAAVDGIFLPERRSAAVTETTHRLSAGALEHVRIARVVNLARLIEEMQEQNVRVICAAGEAEKLWYEVNYKGPIAILVGNEQKGVRRLLREKSDEVVRIPMLGKVSSLNVNVATAVLLYEAIRQRSKDQ